MRASASFHDWRPSAEQELVLKAALLRGQASADALMAWGRTLGGEPLDPGIRRLLPVEFVAEGTCGEGCVNRHTRVTPEAQPGC